MGLCGVQRLGSRTGGIQDRSSRPQLL
jgi:hypothetical protein